MDDVVNLPESVQTILVTRLDALGDIVLGTMLLSGLRARWPAAKIRLVVRPQMAGVTAILPDDIEVVALPFDPRLATAEREAEIIAQLRDFAAQSQADLAVVAEYNRTWAGEILAEICGAGTILAFDGPGGLNFIHQDIRCALGIAVPSRWQTIAAIADEHEFAKYRKFLNAIGLAGRAFEPGIVLRDGDRATAAAMWEKAGIPPAEAIVCFPSSGEQAVRSLDPAVWSNWIEHLSQHRPVMLLGSVADAPVLNAVDSFGDTAAPRVILPPAAIGVLAAILEHAGWYIGMDTGPMHIAAALGRPTLGIFGGGHRAARFLPIGRRAAVVRMPIGCYGCDWLCPFDRRLCIKEIPQQDLIGAGDAFLNRSAENSHVGEPRIFDLAPPATLPTTFLGPIMRQHRQFLKLNHDVTAHHAYLAQLYQQQQSAITNLSQTVDSIADQNHERGQAMSQLLSAMAEMTRQNQSRDQAISRLHQAVTEMTCQNQSRDEAITRFQHTLADMSQQNQHRDAAIAHINETLAEMTRQSQARDGAISHFANTLAEMTRHNEARDQAIAALGKNLE